MACIGGYEILDSIGQGGMGTVYKGRAPDGSAVALKLLHLHLCGIEEFVRRFHREAQLAERLAHPNVVRTLADGEEDGQHYLVMEYVEGRTLLELMREAGLDSASVKNTGGDAPETPAETPPPHPGTAMPMERTIKWTRQIAGVLQAAADIGLVHRDLKPANVIVDARDNAKVLDFGLAKDTEALSSVLSMTGQSLGTPPYMSPEQFEGARDVDVRSDLYSLGATAYHLLTGQAPFAGPTQTAYMHQHLEEIPVPVEKVNPAVPRNLSWVVDRLLAKRPEDRHQTPAELIEDLNRVERGERPLNRYKPRKMRKHKTWHVVAAMLVGMLLIGGLFGGWWWQRSATADTVVAERVLAAKDLAARSRLDEALAVLDKTIASYQAEKPELVADACALRKELRAQRAAAETARLTKQRELVTQGDAKLKVQDYPGALMLYEQAGALGETAEIGEKIATATRWKQEVEDKVATAARIAREGVARKAAAAETERQRGLDLGKALEAATRFLDDGDEDTLDQAREQAGQARELARSAEDIARVQPLRDRIEEALKKRRSWVGVVDFTMDRSVKAELTGSAVAVKLEQALSGRYRLVTRNQVAKALAELKFQASDLADRTKAKQFGQQVGAEYLVTGSVVQIGDEITVAAQIFKVATGAIRQTADNTAVSLREIDTAFFSEIARMLEMTDAEKRTYLDEKRNYPKYLAEGRKLAALEKWDAAAKAFETARRAKRTPEVEALLATAREKAEAQRVLAEQRAAHDLACARGARLLREAKWPEAEAAFRRALAVKGHEQSQEARDGLAKAQGGAARAAFDAACAEGDKLLGAKRWAEAEGAFGRAIQIGAPLAADLRAGAEAGATHAKLGAAVDRAEAAKGKEDWPAVAKAASLPVSAVLSPAAQGLAARLAALRKEAEGHLAPSVRVVCVLDGREVQGARITVNGSGEQAPTPTTLELVEGKVYAIKITLPPRGKTRYTSFAKSLTADWKGERELRAEIEEVTDPTAGNVLGMAFVEVPAGSFRMGSEDGQGDEKPVHEVRISKPFWVGKYEVTQDEYEKLIGKNPSKFKGARNPVECVSWNDAVAFCKKLAEQERSAGRLPLGYEYRLPTEAEWEYAARGGPQSKGFAYSGSNDLGDVGWHRSNSGGKTHEVGGKRANELGTHDMSGNVWEWCLDWHGEYPAGATVDPSGARTGSFRVYRGGGWSFGASGCRVAIRHSFGPSPAISYLGFRAALAPRLVQPAERHLRSVQDTRREIVPTKTTYRVKPGDVLANIAAVNGTTVAALMELNGMERDLIRVGQILTIRGTVGPQAGDTKTVDLGGGVKLELDYARIRGTKLGWHIAGTMPKARILLLMPPMLTGDPGEALLAGLRPALAGEATIVDMVTLAPPRDAKGPDWFTGRLVNRQTAKYQGKVDLVVTGMGLPEQGIGTLWFWRSKIKVAIAAGDVSNLRKAIMAKLVIAATAANPNVAPDDGPPPKDVDAAFAKRYLLITPENVRALSSKHAKLFAR
jgi:formylglycine-generating enzyme